MQKPRQRLEPFGKIRSMALRGRGSDLESLEAVMDLIELGPVLGRQKVSLDAASRSVRFVAATEEGDTFSDRQSTPNGGIK